MCANKFSIGGLIGVHVSSRVYEAIRTISSQFISLFFLRKDFERTKTQIKPKPTNKNKSKRTKSKVTIFRAQKLLRGSDLRFVAFCTLKIFS